MFNRYEEFKYVIENNLMDKAVVKLMLDMHINLGTLTKEEGAELMALLNPKEVSVEE